MFLGGSLGRFSSRGLNHNHFYRRWWWWGNWCWWRNNFWLSRWRCWFRSTFYNWWRQRCCLSRWSRSCRCRSCWCRSCRCCCCWRRWVSSNLSPEALDYCVGDLDYSRSLRKHGMSPKLVCSTHNCSVLSQLQIFTSSLTTVIFLVLWLAPILIKKAHFPCSPISHPH